MVFLFAKGLAHRLTDLSGIVRSALRAAPVKALLTKEKRSRVALLYLPSAFKISQVAEELLADHKTMHLTGLPLTTEEDVYKDRRWISIKTQQRAVLEAATHRSQPAKRGSSGAMQRAEPFSVVIVVGLFSHLEEAESMALMELCFRATDGCVLCLDWEPGTANAMAKGLKWQPAGTRGGWPHCVPEGSIRRLGKQLGFARQKKSGTGKGAACWYFFPSV